MGKNKVSFIIPIYKQKPEILRKCLKSLTDQSYKNIEIICVLDGYDASCFEVIKHFSGCITFVQDNQGAPAARNRGFKESTGEYICFWDSDCYIEPDALAYWVEELDTNSKLDFIYTGYKFSNPAVTAFESEQ